MGHLINFNYFVKIYILLSPAGYLIEFIFLLNLIKRDYIYLQLKNLFLHMHTSMFLSFYTSNM